MIGSLQQRPVGSPFESEFILTGFDKNSTTGSRSDQVRRRCSQKAAIAHRQAMGTKASNGRCTKALTVSAAPTITPIKIISPALTVRGSSTTNRQLLRRSQ